MVPFVAIADRPARHHQFLYTVTNNKSSNDDFDLFDYNVIAFALALADFLYAVFFTGPWRDILEHEMRRDPTSDFLTSFIDPLDKSWYWYHQPCKVFGKHCTEVGPLLDAVWLFMRMSSRLAQSLLDDLYSKNMDGYHCTPLHPTPH